MTCLSSSSNDTEKYETSNYRTFLEYIRLGYRLIKPRKKVRFKTMLPYNGCYYLVPTINCSKFYTILIFKRPVAGEVALVTGAGQGIGRQIAYQLGKLKATVICVDINEETNSETVKHIQDTDGVAFG